ncbi:BREX protein BrxB domain-containing protein [Salinicola sp. LHM]|uniref:BREX protein BrxB domain-containing protein n=1 Tax=Salinicola sp. LHM TaxID=3065298 RepID=UPI002ACE7704|nr:BREX protein BrxB domain-containing protein [Salinicola sp. LHM]WQH32933.1 BREX protein BrxB domain-containing protein [Salinicola sp. LHM]
MSRVRRLVQSYNRHISIPWRDDAAAAQRVIFCVYNENEERWLRARVDEFEIVTKQAGHDWALFDLTNTFAAWLSSQRYAKSYFQKPHLLATVLPKYLDYIVNEFERFLDSRSIGENAVVAIQGVGSLFGFLKVKDVVDKLAPQVPGRLLVFFPGSYENNNYRLLDGYDGWNYLAMAITADKDY